MAITTTESVFLAADKHSTTAWNASVSPAVDCDGNGSDSCYANFARVVHMMDLIVVPIIVGVGVVGNVMSCLVFTCTYLRRVSSSVYLAALAIVDTAYLCVLLFSWLVDFGVQVLQSTFSSVFVIIIIIIIINST